MIRINFENFQLKKFYQSIKNKEDTLRLEIFFLKNEVKIIMICNY